MSEPQPPEQPLAPSPVPNRASFRKRYLFVIGLCFYVLVIWYLGWKEIRDVFVSVRPSLVAAAALLIVSGTWLRAWKWRYALGPRQNAAGLFFMSKGAANWSPARLGEFAPMALRRHRTPRVGAWIVLDRLLEVIVTLVLGLWGLAMIEVIPPAVYWMTLAAAVAGTVLACYLLTRRALFLWVAARTREESWAHRLAMLLAAVSEELFRFRSRLPVALAITVLTKCGDLWAVSLVFLSCGYRAGFALVSAAKCALAIVSFIPLTPVATGVPQITQAWIMNWAADIPYEGLAVAIGIEVAIISVTFWTSFGCATPLMKAAAGSDAEEPPK